MPHIRNTALRAYLIVEVEACREEEAYALLGWQPGVLSVDFVDTPARLVVIQGAETQADMSRRIVGAIAAVGDCVVMVELLPMMLPEPVRLQERAHIA